jgi:hypothetical protein
VNIAKLPEAARRRWEVRVQDADASLPASSRDGVALSRAFTKISGGSMRRCIVSLVERIADQ